MRGKLNKMSHITMEVLIVIDVHGESAVHFHGESDLLLVSQVGVQMVSGKPNKMSCITIIVVH